MTIRNRELITRLYQIGGIQFGEFKLKSGQISSIYINLRKIISYPSYLRAISNAMWEKVRDRQFDLICGVPYTALPIATCLSLDHNIPMVMRRKEKKDYGTKQSIEGVFNPSQSCIIIEDLVTTGSSILETTADLESEGLIVKDVIAFLDREQGGRRNLEAKYRLEILFTLTEVLTTLLNSRLLNEDEHKRIEQFLNDRVTS